MSDPAPTDLPDISQPLPDRGHEAIRQAVVRAIADVQQRADTFYAAIATINTQLAALNTRTDAAQTSAKTAVQNADLLQTQMADVLDRLAALENLTTP